MEDMSAVPSQQGASTEVRGTPETDAAALYAEIIVDLARKLERQRNALAGVLDTLANEMQVANSFGEPVLATWFVSRIKRARAALSFL